MPLGAVFRFSESVAAGATRRPLQDQVWIYRVAPFPCQVHIAITGTNAAAALGFLATFSAGSDLQLGPDAQVRAGGAAGVFEDNLLNFDTFLAAQGDELVLSLRNTNAGSITYNLVVRLEPLV